MNITKEEILSNLKYLKPTYKKEGIEILGLFGSYAKGTQNKFSDIDIAYKLDYKKMKSQQNKSAFRVLIRIDEIKEELQKILKKRVDFVPDKNEEILEGIIYV